MKKSLLLPALAALFCFSNPHASQAVLTVQFDLHPGLNPNETFVTIQNGMTGASLNSIDISYGGTQFPGINTGSPGDYTPLNLVSDPVSVATIMAAGGLDIESANGVLVYLTFGSNTIAGGSAAPGFLPDTPNSTVLFQNFEVTRRPDNPNDQLNITSVDYFTAPLSLQTFHGGLNGTPLQSSGYLDNPGAVAGKIAAVAGPDARVVSNGNVVRYLAPQHAPDAYPSFTGSGSYLEHLGATSATFKLDRSIQYGIGADTYVVRPVGGGGSGPMIASFASDGTITIEGELEYRLITDEDWTNVGAVEIEIAGSDASAAIYEQRPPTSGELDGPGWAALTAALNADVTNDFQQVLLGDVTTGLQAGVIGSTVMFTPPGDDPIAVGDMSASQLYDKTGAAVPPFFSAAQPGDPYYSPWAEAVYNATPSNNVYGFPFAERLGGTGPLIQSVEFNSLSVDTLLVTVGMPIPEPGTWVLLLGAAGILGWRGLMRRRELKS